ncbi:uncharacterized protein METZ01_LOCUS432811, partial [marine metagenome]
VDRHVFQLKPEIPRQPSNERYFIDEHEAHTHDNNYESQDHHRFAETGKSVHASIKQAGLLRIRFQPEMPVGQLGHYPATG